MNGRHYLWTILLFFWASSLATAQWIETPLKDNAVLPKTNRWKRTDHAERVIFYLPVGGTKEFCASAITGTSGKNSLFDLCETPSFGSFVISDSCVIYTHAGIRGTDKICLEVCDSNNRCESFEIVLVSGPVAGLPFVDDFSSSAPFPDTNRWLSNSVFVNYTLAEDPPSLGVATFDGLDATGTPYSNGFGFSDELSSIFLDLSGEDEVFFSFFVQPKGVGIKPRIADSLTLDFRTHSGEWVRIWQLEGLPNSVATRDPAPPFTWIRFPVPDSLLHGEFQFRFRNKSKNEGLQELWHVDYIRIGSEEITREKFRDIAFLKRPASILSPYSHMPAFHFETSEVRRNILSQVINLDQFDLTMNDPIYTVSLNHRPLLRRTFIEPVSNWLLKPGNTSFDFDMNDGGSTNYERLQQELETNLSPDSSNAVITSLEFIREDEVIGASVNNRVSTITHFSNYFAYDDGSAESALIDRGESGVRPTILAQEFHSNREDILQGIQFHIPHIEGNSSNLFFNLYVWIDSLDDEPEFVQNGVRVYYADNFFDTLQGFTTYDLRDESSNKINIPLPTGKFYIGWEQANISGIKIPFGYDLNSPEGFDFLYFNVGTGWLSARTSGLRPGSVMVRAVVGNDEVIHTSTIEEEREWDLKIFPTPSSGLIYLSKEDPGPVDLEIINLWGQRLFQSGWQQEIDVSHFPAGTYFLKATDPLRNQRTVRLFVIQH